MRRFWLLFVILVVSLTTLVADTTVFDDPFEETTNTTLASHVPDTVGTGWTLNEDTSATLSLFTVFQATDRVQSIALTNSVHVSYITVPNPALDGADYYVQFTLTVKSSASDDDPVFLMLRRTAADTYYALLWYSDVVANDCYIGIVNAGTWTQIANADCNFVDGSVVKFGITGSGTLTGYKDGVSAISGTNGTIASAGAGGFGCGNIRISTDDCSNGWAVDNFSQVDTVESAPSTARGLTTLGVGE